LILKKQDVRYLVLHGLLATASHCIPNVASKIPLKLDVYEELTFFNKHAILSIAFKDQDTSPETYITNLKRITCNSSRRTPPLVKSPGISLRIWPRSWTKLLPKYAKQRSIGCAIKWRALASPSLPPTPASVCSRISVTPSAVSSSSPSSGRQVQLAPRRSPASRGAFHF